MHRIALFVASLVFCLIATCRSEIGVNLLEKHCAVLTPEIASCLAKNSSFIIIEAYNPDKEVIPHLQQCLQTLNERYAKFELHATLCPKCGNGHEGFKLINEINEAVKDVKDKVGMLWLNVDCIGKHQGERVEHCGWNKPDYWGAKVGIFTEMRDWDYITDNSKFLGQTLGMPLWYRGVDGRPDFDDDFHNFGGWEDFEKHGGFLRKQYRTHASVCGLQNLHLNHQSKDQEPRQHHYYHEDELLWFAEALERK